MQYKSFSAKIKIRRIPYYIQSLKNLYDAVKPGYKTDFIRTLFISNHTRIIHLKNNLVFKLVTLLDILTLKEVVIDNEYQTNGVKINKNDKIIVDIGAGFGDFAVMTAKRFPKTKIYAFEPDPRYFELLGDNLKLNKVNNIIPFKKAITSLNEVFRLIKSNNIEFIKMDCEGGEFKIFDKKNSNLVRRIKKVVMEYHEDGELKVTMLESFFKNAKFTVKVFPQRSVEGIGKLAAALL